MVERLTPNNRSAIQRVLREPDLQPILFREASGLKWFDAFDEEGFFDPRQNPSPTPVDPEGAISIPIWPVTYYLVSVSEELEIEGNEEYAIKALDRIRNATRFAQTNDSSNYRTWWQFAKVIKHIPTRLITIKDIELVDYWLDDPYDRAIIADEIGMKWLPKVLSEPNAHNNEISLALIDLLFEVHFEELGSHSLRTREPVFRYDAWHANEIAKKVGYLSGSMLGIQAVVLFQARLCSILEELNNDAWSSIWRSAIEDHAQNHGRDASSVIVNAYRDCLLGLVDYDTAMAVGHIGSILASEYETMRRVAIYTINQKYDHLKDLIDNVLALNCLDDNLRHELWHLLNSRYDTFKNSQKSRVIELIQNIEVTDNDEIVHEKATAYRRAQWLSAIKDVDDKAAGLYAEYTVDQEPDHPDFSSYMTVRWGRTSPIPIERLLPLNTDDLVNTINAYVSGYEHLGRFEDAGIEGLVDTFKTLVEKKADEIFNELPKFIDCDLAFIYPIIGTYHRLWNEKKELSWSNVWPSLLAFCAQVIEKDGFWSKIGIDERRDFVANSGWVVSEIAHLIEDGVRKDEHSFDLDLLPVAKSLVLTMLVAQKSEEFRHDRDAVSTTINSARGRCLEALINLTLRECRLSDLENNNDHSRVWLEYEPVYESEISKDPGYEIATLMSMYLPNFLYISREWTLSNLSRIFGQSNYQRWLCAMQGYSYVKTLYHEIYVYLKNSGDLLKALDDSNLKGRLEDRMVQNLVVGYLNDYENIDEPDSLISILLKRKEYDEVKAIIWFIWTLREEVNDTLKTKVFELWPRLLDIVDLGGKEGSKLASQLCHWAAFVDELDETTEGLLMQVAPYAQVEYNTPDLLNSLSKISDKQPLEAQKIWLRMLDVPSYDYPEDAIRNILTNLVKLGPEGKRNAREITDAYLRYDITRPMMWLEQIESSIAPN